MRMNTPAFLGALLLSACAVQPADWDGTSASLAAAWPKPEEANASGAGLSIPQGIIPASVATSTGQDHNSPSPGPVPDPSPWRPTSNPGLLPLAAQTNPDPSPWSVVNGGLDSPAPMGTTDPTATCPQGASAGASKDCQTSTPR